MPKSFPFHTPTRPNGLRCCLLGKVSAPHFVIPAEGRGGFKPSPTANNVIFQGLRVKPAMTVFFARDSSLRSEWRSGVKTEEKIKNVYLCNSLVEQYKMQTK